MEKSNELKQKRSQRDYNIGSKLAVVSQVEKGELTYKQDQTKYGIQGRSTVLVWLRKHLKLMKEVKAKRSKEFFVSDITYIKSRERTHYLSLVTDAYSRKIMGYKLSVDMSTESVVKALKMAIKREETTVP
jgi:transposase InsO family protein